MESSKRCFELLQAMPRASAVFCNKTPLPPARVTRTA